MNYTICSVDQLQQPGDCLIIGYFCDTGLAPSAKVMDDKKHGWISEFIEGEGFQGKPGDSLQLTPAEGDGYKRIIIVGLGKSVELNAKAFRKAVRKAAVMLASTKAKNVFCTLTEVYVLNQDNQWKARQIAQHLTASTYSFNQLKSADKSEQKLQQVFLLSVNQADNQAIETGVAQGDAIAQGMHFAKDLANFPGNYCTPTYLAQQATELAGQCQAMKVDVIDEEEMQKLGMGSLLSVSRGSREPAKLIVLEYKGGSDDDQPVVLVGKGITFDSGGISIKPSAAMDEMKYDMCGAASVLGTLKTIAELKLPINVVGIIPSSENLPDGYASKPGDVVTSMSGTTIEVLNTDAEGRLVLCDALTYAKRFNPAVVIDIATLTGACVIALGKHISGLLGNDDALCQSLSEAGDAAGDPVWRLPMTEDYDQQLKSNFADVANIGGREAGTITAGCFLGRFTKDYTWAHLDIAGTAWNSGKAKGATGRPVPLLTQFLLNRIN
ncbi:MAG TPA: leucyl aminopeptidase [Crenotrichaceae bacterium]|nr:leucyl aminopeptidase [Crenotrichaceae bacterium]